MRLPAAQCQGEPEKPDMIVEVHWNVVRTRGSTPVCSSPGRQGRKTTDL